LSEFSSLVPEDSSGLANISLRKPIKRKDHCEIVARDLAVRSPIAIDHVLLLVLGEIDMVDEKRSAQNESFTEEAAELGATDSGEDPATEIIETLKALPDDTSQVVVTKILQELSHEQAKKEIATSVVESLPDDATEAKKKVVQESVRDFSPEFRDYLIANLVTMRHLFRRVFVWTIFGASAVAIVIAILTAVELALGGSEQIQNLLWVVIPVATLLLGYSFGRTHSEQADIKRLRGQNPEKRNGTVVNSNVTPPS